MNIYTVVSLKSLRKKIKLVDIVKNYIELTQEGDVYKGICPFHEVTSPSLKIYPEKNHYHCIACGAHGDAISFLIDYLKLSFVESVETLAKFFAVEMEMINEAKNKNSNITRYDESIDAKDHLITEILKEIKYRDLTDIECSEIMKISLKKLNSLYSLSISDNKLFSIDHLIQFLNNLGKDIDIVVRPSPLNRKSRIHVFYEK